MIHIWCILAFCESNLLFMHYYIRLTSHLESETDVTTYIDNFCGTIFDISIIFLLLFVFFRNRIKAACIICFFTTWLWSFCNVIYSRFFHHYLTISAIGESDALGNSIIIKSIINNIQWIDLYYPVILLIFIFILNCKSPSKTTIHIKTVLYSFCILLLIELSIHACYMLSDPSLVSFGYYRYRISTLHVNKSRFSLQPNYIHFIRGSFRCLAVDIFNSFQGVIKLSEKDFNIINKYIKSSQGKIANKTISNPENIIFILVESYMSFVSDIKINGHEVTPFLNSIQRDSSVYFNRHMQENVTLGESSDGQFIYVTGLLPLRSTITISRAKDITLPGLPKLLGRESRMIIPTIASMWRQDEMCRQYGFDKLYTSDDFEGDHKENLNDRQVFQLAMQKDTTNKTNFFSFIVTMSMHQPYTEQIDSTFIIPTSQSISKELACYLNACHYTDQQIENYFNYLKEQNLYEKSLIIIAADHAVHCTDFGGVSKDLPFYIINAEGLPQNMIRDKKCNQVDLYSTLIDILGIKSNWHGVGCSLLSSKYEDNIPASKWDISELIIQSDYFSQTTDSQ